MAQQKTIETIEIIIRPISPSPVFLLDKSREVDAILINNSVEREHVRDEKVRPD